MRDDQLLDYDTPDSERFDFSDVPLPMRVLTGVYLLSWIHQILRLWMVGDWNIPLFWYQVFDWGLIGAALWTHAAATRSKDSRIGRCRLGFWAGVSFFVFREMAAWLGLATPILNVFSMVAYFFMFTSLVLWLVRYWALRSQGPAWWSLLERWSWNWAAVQAMALMTTITEYLVQPQLDDPTEWAFPHWTWHLFLIALTLWPLWQCWSALTEKERRVCLIGWLAFNGLATLYYGGLIPMVLRQGIITLSAFLVFVLVLLVRRLPA